MSYDSIPARLPAAGRRSLMLALPIMLLLLPLLLLLQGIWVTHATTAPAAA
jgi:hypothetical protein